MVRSTHIRLLLALSLALTLVTCGECFARDRGGPVAGSSPVVINNDTYVHNDTYVDEDPIDVEPIDVDPMDPDPVDVAPIDPAQPAPAPPGGNTEWMSLGTFDLAPGPHAAPSREMQLSISKQGKLRGVYSNQTTGATQNLTGTLHHEQKLLTWHVEGNPGVQYETTLNDLTSGHGKVLVMQASGAFEWTVTRRD